MRRGREEARHNGSGESANHSVSTVAIPTYKRAKYLAELLSVVEKQVRSETEVAVSDNCSTGSTGQAGVLSRGRARNGGYAVFSRVLRGKRLLRKKNQRIAWRPQPEFVSTTAIKH